MRALVDRYMRAQLWTFTPYVLAIPSGQPLYDAFFNVTPSRSFDQWCEVAGEDVTTLRSALVNESNEQALQSLRGIGGPVIVKENGEAETK